MKKLMLILVFAVASVMFANAGTATNLINVSWGDNIVIGSGFSKLDTPEKIRVSMEAWRELYDGKTILWRISSEYLRRFYVRQPSSFQARYDAKVEEIAKVFDAASLVREETRRLGQTFLLYATFLDHGAPTNVLYGGGTPFPWQDQVTIEHPEYQERDLRGNYHYGVLDLSVPGARSFMVNRLVNFVTEYDSDGLYLCSRTHSDPALHADQFGFGPAVVGEYQRRYGIDITQDARFDWTNENYAPQSPEVENWRRLRGEYLLTFLVELRTALEGKLLYVALPGGDYLGAPYGNMHLDTDGIIKRKLADGLVLGVCSGRWLYPNHTTSHKDIGYLISYDDNYNVLSTQATIARFAPNCASNNVALFFSGGYRHGLLEAGLNGVMIGSPRARPTLLIESSPLFSVGSLSIDGWFNLSKDYVASAQTPRLLSKYSHHSSAQRGWELRVDNKTGRPEFRVNLVLPGGSRADYTLTSTQAIPRDVWVHIAAVLDRPQHECRLYIDGNTAGTLKLPGSFSLNDNAGIHVLLGSYAGGTQHEARMRVDELRISSIPHTFSSAPQAPYTGEEPGTLALFHFDTPEKKADVLAPGLKLRFIGAPPIESGRFSGSMHLLE